MIARGRILDLGLAALVAAQLGASAWLVPFGDQLRVPGLPGGASDTAGGGLLGGLCWFRAAFDLDCPFCGMTRSFVAVAHGELAAALGFHPAGPLLFVAMLAALIAIVVVGVRRGRPVVERRGFLRALEAVAVICVVVGLFKMVRS